MAARLGALLLCILLVGIGPVAAQQPRPKTLTGHLTSPPQGRFPNGISYRFFVVNGRARLGLENKSDKATQAFTVWVALFDATKKLREVYSFGVPPYEPNDPAAGYSWPEDQLQPEGPDAWPAGGASSYRVAYWEGAVADYPGREVQSLLIAPIRGGLTHTTKDFSIRFRLNPEEIGFALTNTGPQPIRVVWDECAFIDANGRTHRVLHVGVRYINRDKAIPPSVVPPGARLEDIIFPTSHIEYDSGSGWERKPLYEEGTAPAPFGVFLHLRVGSKPVEVTYKFAFKTAWPQHVTSLFGP